MGYYDSVEISASGLSAERLAMDVIANNIANANTTRTPEGGAFKRQLVIFAQKPGAPDSTQGGGDTADASGNNGADASGNGGANASGNSGADGGSNASGNDSASDADDANDPFAPPDPFSAPKPNVEGVQVVSIVNDPTPDRLVFDPGNPEADPRGYVHYPNVEIVKEMVDMMAASRAYQANVAAITASNNMGASDLSLLKS